jgi:arginyl-tRNA synthetase
MMHVIHQQLEDVLRTAGVTGDISFSTPPNSDMGDLAFACFAYAKQLGKNPAEAATDIATQITVGGITEEVKAFGPYVNFYLNKKEVAKIVLVGIKNDSNYGALNLGSQKKVMVEYACPNPMKAFHLGHLKNLITGESIVRLMENAGYDVIRANYQGDVGMHIAKTMWGLFDWREQFDAMRDAPLRERVEFLGKAYAHGATAYAESEEKKAEVVAYNKKIYEQDTSILEVYVTARAWSLEYFGNIYASLGTQFDLFYYESVMYKRALEIVRDGLQKGIFFESEGAILFPGEKYGLHDRVYINSEGYPTYDAKDLALSEDRFAPTSEKARRLLPHLDEVIHVVGKEQTEYFKVVFAAYEALGMKGAGKESHLIGGFLQLKGDQKMSSRTGNIVTGDQLLEQVRQRITHVMIDAEIEQKDDVITKVTSASLKYAMLRADISKDVAFDLEESISTSGNSGPYLLYIVARINSILKKVGHISDVINWDELSILPEEHVLAMKLAEYPVVTEEATIKRDTSVIAKYLFDLAQTYNSCYAVSHVSDATGSTQAYRTALIKHTRDVMTRGLWLLGIDTVESM